MDYYTLRPRLQAIARSDAHTGHDGRYHIRSLYFDNPGDKALREKLDGVNERDKFRIRYYNYDTSYIIVEKKSKKKSLCQKQSVRISREECERLLKGQLSWMYEKKEALFVELYTRMMTEQYRPKTIVDYIREPYIFSAGNVRVTFDMNIRTGLYTTDLLNDKISLIPACEPGMMILEVKYDNYIPDLFRGAFMLKGRNCTAFSKYAVCRKFG